MKRRVLKVIAGLLGVLLLVVVGSASVVPFRWKRTFEAPYPTIKASTDSARIARGKYLAYGPAHCAYCHTPMEDWKKLDAGEFVPLRGGAEFKLPFGIFYSRNITPDPETGIGTRTDGELFRILRHGVRADGRAALPFMEFHNMSDEDLIAVISFLRSQPSVMHEIPEHQVNFMGKVLLSYLIKPVGPSGTPPATSPPEGPTIERGAYLANNVAACVGCHTRRSMKDGSYIGPKFAGGGRFTLDHSPGTVLITPNLTPDPETGHITWWSEQQFVDRFRAGSKIEGTHMPWAAYGRMSDDDIRAIYRYLRALPPVKQDNGPMVQTET